MHRCCACFHKDRVLNYQTILDNYILDNHKLYLQGDQQELTRCSCPPPSQHNTKCCGKYFPLVLCLASLVSPDH